MTTTTRICLDMLTSARARREEYVGPWLPEPVVDTAALAPDSRTELAEDLSIALLLTLDRCRRSSALPSCCTTCSISRSAKWLRHWSGATLRAGSLQPAHVRTCPQYDRAAPPRRRRVRARSMRKHAQLISAFAAATQSGDLNALTHIRPSRLILTPDRYPERMEERVTLPLRTLDPLIPHAVTKHGGGCVA
jgi:RNA polymerase sigma-70 factor, ECF subfamily